jgi:hypothetical protein
MTLTPRTVTSPHLTGRLLPCSLHHPARTFTLPTVPARTQKHQCARRQHAGTAHTAPHNDADTTEVTGPHDDKGRRPCSHARALRCPCTRVRDVCARRQHAAAARTPPHMTLTPRTVMSPHLTGRLLPCTLHRPARTFTLSAVHARTHNTNVHVDSMLPLHAHHYMTLTPRTEMSPHCDTSARTLHSPPPSTHAHALCCPRAHPQHACARRQHAGAARTPPHMTLASCTVTSQHQNTTTRTSTPPSPSTHAHALRHPCRHAQHACARHQHAGAARTPPHMTLTPRTVMSPHLTGRLLPCSLHHPPRTFTLPTVPARTHNTNLHVDIMLSPHCDTSARTLHSPPPSTHVHALRCPRVPCTVMSPQAHSEGCPQRHPPGTSPSPPTHAHALHHPCTHAQHACARHQHAGAARTPPHIDADTMHVTTAPEHNDTHQHASCAITQRHPPSTPSPRSMYAH